MELIVPGYGLVLVQILGLLTFLMWIFALIDCLRSEFEEPNQRLVWVIVIVFVPFLGPLLYFAISKKGRRKRKFEPDFHRF